MIRVLIAEDHHLVRAGIRALLERYPGIQVVGEAATGLEAVELAERLGPDIVLMDINMPQLNGLQALARIRSSQASTRVVMLTVYSDQALVREAMQLGAHGYLLKTSAPAELLLALEAANRGEIYLSPAVSQPLIADALRARIPDESSAIKTLSPREREVLQLIAEGQTTAEIAVLLVLSAKTVEKHRTNLMNKLGVHEIAGLVRVAIKYKLVFLED